MIFLHNPTTASNFEKYLYDSVSQQISLKFNLYSTSWKGEQCDFAVSSADGIQFNCHKVIIAVFSNFFRNCLLPGDVLTVDGLIFADFSSEEVASLLNLIYSGRFQRNIIHI